MREDRKMECGIENVSEELEGVCWGKWNGEGEMGDRCDRGERKGTVSKGEIYQEVENVCNRQTAWIPSATVLIQCQLLNERQHSHAKTSVPSRFISPAGFLFFHLTPPADAAHCLGPRRRLIINQTELWSLPPSFDGSLFMASDFLPLTSPDLVLLRLTSELHSGSTGGCFLIVTPAASFAFPAFSSSAKALCPCINPSASEP